MATPIKGHLSYMATYSLQKGWPYKKGTTVFVPEIETLNQVDVLF